VGLPEQFFPSVTADVHEIRVAVGDAAFGIGDRDHRLVGGKVEISLSVGQVDAHADSMIWGDSLAR